MNILRHGDSGKDVAYLIACLRSAGYGVNVHGERFLTEDHFTDAVLSAVLDFQSSHIGWNGKFLDCDGVVGPQTWWALQHPDGALQKSLIGAQIPGGLGYERTKVLKAAMIEYGLDVHEVPNGSNGGDGVDKYFEGTGLHHVPWCGCFVSWVMRQALGRHPLEKPRPSTWDMAYFATKNGMWFPIDQSIPGDLFMILHTGGIGHVGFVLRVDYAKRLFNTIEGNCGNRVKRGLRGFDDRDMAGCIRYLPAPEGDWEQGIVEANATGNEGDR